MGKLEELIKKDKLECEYCGKSKEEITFIVGSSDTPDWVMNERTEKISCPDCYELGRKESQQLIEKALDQYESVFGKEERVK